MAHFKSLNLQASDSDVGRVKFAQYMLSNTLDYKASVLAYHVAVASREAVHYEIINMCLSSTAHLHISAYVLEVTVCVHRH